MLVFENRKRVPDFIFVLHRGDMFCLRSPSSLTKKRVFNIVCLPVLVIFIGVCNIFLIFSLRNFRVFFVDPIGVLRNLVIVGVFCDRLELVLDRHPVSTRQAPG